MEDRIISTSHADYKISFQRPFIYVRAKKPSHLEDVIKDAGLNLSIKQDCNTKLIALNFQPRRIGTTRNLSSIIKRSSPNLFRFYIEVPEEQWEITELAISTFPENKFTPSEATLLIAARRAKPKEETQLCSEEIKEIAPFVYAVRDVMETAIYRGCPSDGRSAEFMLLRVNFDDSKLKMTLDEDYADKLAKVDPHYLCEFGDEDMIVHAINLYRTQFGQVGIEYHHESKYESFLLCFRELVKRFGCQSHLEDVTLDKNNPVEEKQDIYQGNMKNLGYMAREDSKFGSISYHDNYSEESSGQENENDFYDGGVSVFAEQE